MLSKSSKAICLGVEIVARAAILAAWAMLIGLEIIGRIPNNRFWWYFAGLWVLQISVEVITRQSDKAAS